MIDGKIKLLLIEDNPDDIELLQRSLGKSVNVQFSVKSVPSMQKALDHLAGNKPDIILSDLGLPDSHGLDTVTKLMCDAPNIPLVVLSGFDDEVTAIKAVQSGAQDYLVKGQLEGRQLERSLFYAIERARLQTELEQHAQEISGIQANLLKILDKNADAIIIAAGKDRKILFANPAAEALFGRQKKGLVNKMFEFPLDGGKTSEIGISPPSGEKTIAEMNVVEISWEGQPAYLASLRDITKRKKMEEDLRVSEEKFSKAFRHSPESFVISGIDDGTIVEANDTFMRNSGFGKEIIGKKSIEAGVWAFPEERAEVVKILKEKGMISNLERHLRVKNGEIGTSLFSAEIITINNTPYMLSMTTDITERKKMEEKLRFSHAAFRSIHESVIATDTKYVITHWNEISEKIYGIKAAEAIGKRIPEVIEIDENLPGENDRRVERLESYGYYREEQLHRTKYGEVWVDVSVQAIEENGKRYGWVMLASAITQRKLAEEALKRSEEKYRELIDTSSDGIVSTDSQMRFVVWNRGAEKLLGYTEKEMLGQSVMTIVPEPHRSAVARELIRSKLHEPGKVVSQIFETQGLKKDCSLVPMEVSLSTRKSENKWFITAIMRDITVRKEAEEKLRRIEQMKSEFLSNVSHELRTPLQSISGFTKLIMNGQVPDPATRQEFFQIIDRETQHLGSLINGLLDMSRLESGRFHINRKPTAVRETMIDAVKSFHTLARDKNITLHEEIPDELPEMEVDDERLRQVFFNLLSNAIKYSDAGGSVTVRVKRIIGELLFQISDNGIGMSLEAMKHLFERFYRAEENPARSGTGLGLYITKQIIDAHGGRIWAESKVNQGSTFSFTLPYTGKGGNGHGKKNIDHRRRPSDIKTR
jgi:PAS domain S-box-containing protein